MLPGWVADLEDYWRWVEQLLDSSGGYIHPGDILFVSPVIAYDRGPWLTMFVDHHRLRCSDGSYLDFSFVVSSALELEEYGFHYARADDTLVWRHDRHDGHEHQDGMRSHVHLPDGRRRRHQPVDLEDVLRLISEDQAERSVPRS